MAFTPTTVLGLRVNVADVEPIPIVVAVPKALTVVATVL